MCRICNGAVRQTQKFEPANEKLPKHVTSWIGGKLSVIYLDPLPCCVLQTHYTAGEGKSMNFSIPFRFCFYIIVYSCVSNLNK